MFEKQQCHFENCNGPVLPFSEPPSCSVHIQDIDEWFESLAGKLSSTVFDELGRTMILILAKEIYRNSLFNESVGKELYKDFKNRIDPRDEVQFSFVDVIYFVLIAATSGIVGNFAYDALRKLLRRIGDRNKKLDEKFEETVNPEKYEELRKMRHPGTDPKIEVDVEIEIKIKRKYRILMKE